MMIFEMTQKMNWGGNVVALLLGSMAAHYGGFLVPMMVLVMLTIVDYATGVFAAKVVGEEITSKKSSKGIFRKLIIWLLAAAVVGLDILVERFGGALGIGIEQAFPFIFTTIVVVWLGFNELISITENANKAGVNIRFLGPFIKLLQKKVESAIPKIEDAENKEQEDNDNGSKPNN